MPQQPMLGVVTLCPAASSTRCHALTTCGAVARSVQWASSTHFPLDTRIVACTMDGMVMDWSLRELRKEADHSDKRFHYHAVAADDKCVWVVGTPASRDNDSKWRVKLREIESVNMHGDTVANDYEFPELHITTLALASQHRLLERGVQRLAVEDVAPFVLNPRTARLDAVTVRDLMRVGELDPEFLEQLSLFEPRTAYDR